MSTYSCNCAYGTQDPRCCVAKARRAELEEAHRLGREGEPLPGPGQPIRANGWFDITPESMRMLDEERAALARTEGEAK